jgi:hypothetical protein
LYVGRGLIFVLVVLKELSMSRFFSIVAALFVFFAFSVFGQSVLHAQGLGRPTNFQVQLPVVSFFNVRTVVSVPDGGTMSLGGVSRSESSRSTRGIPGFSGRLFQNRSTSQSLGRSNATVTATVISNQEISDSLMAEGYRRSLTRQRFDPNGAPAVQAQADFISRNIGRKRR